MSSRLARPLARFRAIQAQQDTAAAVRWATTRAGHAARQAAGRARLFAHDPWLLRAAARDRLADDERYGAEAFLPSMCATTAPVTPGSVAVVVPVYGDAEATRACLSGVLEAASPAVGEVIVVDDASPDPAIVAYLDGLAASGAVRLLRNAANLGFVASANAGMAAAGRRDVVLLNSDTEVAGDWADRLAAHAARDFRVATVTPFTDNGTIATYPSPPGPARPPLDEAVETLDRAFRTVNRGRACALPTAVGFCMFITRRGLDEVGAFDALGYGRGYGEENDFCLRATAAGYVHLLAADVFVRHRGEASFGAEARQLREAAVERLVRQYPDYVRSLERFDAADPARPYRVAATAARWRDGGRPVLLHVLHAQGTGTERHVVELCASLRGRAHCLVLEGRGPDTVRLRSADPADRLDLTWRASGSCRSLVDLLRSFGVSRAHVHHTLDLPLDARALVAALGVPFDFTVHDYHAVCPRIRVAYPCGLGCCEGPDEAVCDACLARPPQAAAVAYRPWREAHRWLLEESERVICPSLDAAARISPFVAGAELVVAPHDQLGELGFPPPAPPLLAAGETLRVAVFGVLSEDKGLRAVTESLPAGGSRGERPRVELIGFIPDELASLARHTALRATGPYAPEELPERLERFRPHVVWFPAVWPETFSYTLSEAFAAGLPVVASDVGAFRERALGRPWSWLTPWDTAPGDFAAVWETVAGQLRSGVWDGPWVLGAPDPDVEASGLGDGLTAEWDFYRRRYLGGRGAVRGEPGG